jgi:heme/copper-type cytochrome/quinol oxidase subunit 2
MEHPMASTSGIGFAFALVMRIPVVLVVFLAVANSPWSSEAAQDAGRPDLQASEVRLIEFEVVARQFEFVPSRLEVRQGDKVRILVRSEDRNHGLGIRKFKVNKIVPASGKVVTIEFEAKEAGTFEILCSESCGNGHKDMKGTLVVAARQPGTVEQP